MSFYQAVVTYPRDITVGIFEAQEDLDKYEKAWNDVVFDRAYSNLRTEVCITVDPTTI